MKQKITCIIFALLMAISCVFPANTTFYANQTSNTSENLTCDIDVSNLMPCIESVISDENCSEYSSDDFESLFIGNAIHTYELLENGHINATDFVYYPVFSNERLLFLVLKKDDGLVQMTQGFTDVLSNYLGQNVAIIYDIDEAYVLSEDTKTMEVAYKYSENVETRANLLQISESIENSVTWTKLERYVSIELASNQVNPRYDPIMPTVTLPVPVRLQLPYENICWAASTAAIGNYLTDSSYVPVYIAIQLHGNSYFNKGATLAQSIKMLKSIYGITYSSYSTTTAPTESRIYTNISAGYPLYGRWEVSSGSTHQTVIRGINHTSGYIYVMDPMQGYVTASKSNGEFYYVAETGQTLKLIGYASKS